MKLRFSDGTTVDTSGEYRILRLSDGMYVTGHGFLCPVDSIEEANELIKQLGRNSNRRVE